MKRTIVVALAAIAVLAIAAPSFAASGSTTVQVTIGGGALTISSPASKDLGSVSAQVGSTASGTLGTTTITDARGTLLGWTVTAVTSGNLVGSGGNTIALSEAGPLAMVTGTVSASGASLLTGVAAGAGGFLNPNATGLTSVTVATAALAAGGGIYTYNPTLTLTVPANAAADTYSTTIVQTVA